MLDKTIADARAKRQFVSNLSADWLEMEYFLEKESNRDVTTEFTMSKTEFVDLWKNVATEKRLTGFGQAWCNCSRGQRRSSDADLVLKAPQLEAPPPPVRASN